MESEKEVLAKLNEFIKENKMFTSVDLANAVKADGIWVRNRDIRDWLKSRFEDKGLFQDYAISSIYVCNGTSVASLYHPLFCDPNDYLDRDQRPLTPDEVKQIQKDHEAKKVDFNKLMPNDVDEEDNIELSVVLRSIQRLKIPGSLIRAMGWVPGQVVDTSKIHTKEALPTTLKVNDDYRVSIPRSSVPWGTKPVRVLLKGGEIHFEKA